MFHISILLLIVYSITSINILVAQQRRSDYKPFDSDTRYIFNLRGNWEMSEDEEEWQQVRVPYSNQDYSRIVYKRIIKIEDKIIDKYVWQLYFLGVNDQVEVYFNEQFVGRYFGGITPLVVKLPSRFMMAGANTIKLSVQPATHTASQVKLQNLFYRKDYTGIIRDVYLVGTPPVWISSLKHKTQQTSASTFNLTANINVSSGNLKEIQKSMMSDTLKQAGSLKTMVTLNASLIAQSNNQVIAQSQPVSILIERERSVTENINFHISSPALWFPENPALYKLKITISKDGNIIDELNSVVGFRSISIKSDGKNPQFFVNGNLFKLKGAVYVEDYKNYGQTLTLSQMEKDVELLKMLGANVIRIKYYPPHPYLAELCNKYGLFMMLELPVYETPGSMLGMDEIKVRMFNLAKSMIAIYDNNPSVFAWGITDGVEEGNPTALEFTNNIIKLFKRNSNNIIYKTVYIGTKELYANNFDFINIKISQRQQNFDDVKMQIKFLQDKSPNKPLLVTFGIPIQPTNHNGYSDPLSLESQAYYIRNSYFLAMDLNTSGCIISTFNDYLLHSPLLIIPNEDPYLFTSGLVDRSRDMRLSFEMLQALFNNEKEPLLNAGSNTEKTPITFIFVGLALCLVFMFLINRFRRFREYIFRSLLRPYNFYADIRDQRIISSIQTFLLGIVISFTLGITVASLFYFYRSNIMVQYLYMLFIPSKALQQAFYSLVWMPEIMMIISSLIIFVFIFLLSLILRLFAFLVRSRIYISDTFIIIIWSSIPILLLLPLSIILIRLLVLMPQSIWFILVGIALIKLWVLLRILRSTSVVFDISAFRTYLVGFIFIILCITTILSIYQYQISIFSYFRYFLDVMLTA